MSILDPIWSALTDLPVELRHHGDEEVYSATPPYSAKYTLRSDRKLVNTQLLNLSEKQQVTEGVLCSEGGTEEMALRSNTHSFANPSLRHGYSGGVSKVVPSTDAVMPSIAELACAAGLSKLKEKRLLQTAAKDLRQGRVQVPSHIPSTNEERLKWVFIYRLAQLLGNDAFDRVLQRAFGARTAA